MRARQGSRFHPPSVWRRNCSLADSLLGLFNFGKIAQIPWSDGNSKLTYEYTGSLPLLPLLLILIFLNELPLHKQILYYRTQAPSFLLSLELSVLLQHLLLSAVKGFLLYFHRKHERVQKWYMRIYSSDF